MKSLDVLFTPADFAQLKQEDLGDAVCVVFDVLRATSSMVVALANGAQGIIPVEEIPEALALRARNPRVLLAGEREGVRIQAGSVAFDLGNSPREFTTQAVRGHTVVMTTTNGTRALRSCADARLVLAGALLNLTVTAEFVLHQRPSRLLIICSGTHEQTAYEDVLAAGALCDLVWDYDPLRAVSDSALMARQLWLQASTDLLSAISQSRNARRLLAMPELREDVAFCARRDAFRLVAQLGRDGVVRQVSQ